MRALATMLLLAGCTTDTEIIGTLRSDGPPTPLAVAGQITSLGLIDGSLLITTVTPITAPPTGWPEHVIAGHIQWVSSDDEIGPVTDIGWSTWATLAPQWARVGDRLVGAVWAEPTPGPAPPSATSAITMWSLPIDGSPLCHDTPRLPVYVDPDFPTVLPAGAGTGFDLQAFDPVGIANGRAVALASAQPFYMCRWDRLLTVSLDACTATAGYAIDASALCEPPVDPGSTSGYMAAVPLGDDLGVLYRPASTTDNAIRWVVLRDGMSQIGTPVVVGSVPLLETFAMGVAPRGAAVGNRVGFFETTNSRGTCFVLRMLNRDGTSARDADWQLPCRRDGHGLSANAQLLPFPDAALSIALVTQSDRTDVNASVVTENGRRGTEVRVVSASSAAGALDFHATTDGNSAAVVYSDASGYWLQRFTFVRN